MNQSLERILINLAGNTDLQQISLEELENITEAYPYFSVSHILLAKKLQLQKNEHFQKQAQRAALYTHNPWWLHFQLTEETELPVAKKSELPAEPAKSPEIKTEVSQVQEVPVSHIPLTIQSIVPINDRERVVLTDGDDNITPEELLVQPTKLPVVNEEEEEPLPAIPVDDDFDTDPGFDKEEAEETNDDEVLHAHIEEEEEAVIPEHRVKEEVTTEPELVPITTVFTQEELEVADKLAHETLAEVETGVNTNALFALPGNNAEPVSEAVITTEFTQEELDESSKLAHEILSRNGSELHTEPMFILPGASKDISETEPDEEINQVSPVEEKTGNGTVEVVSEETEPEKEIQQVDDNQLIGKHQAEEELEPEKEMGPADDTDYEMPEASPEDFSNNQMLQNIKSILDTPLTTDKAAAQSTIPIDPYYTVDYFASQGIKLVLENDPNDKLGKKLKKFTQWLKHMKKLGPEDALETDNEEDLEATVIRIADFSNTQREIITEAMAAVLEKQGKNEKAIQIYIKLSFLHPDKSAYFADKIKILKGIK
ncbi:MAG: hypothetical protein LH478_13750 [Chitinophagaceae bacterium]|nr:hypothetical protein [Chitinophagaceae bacterium]